MPTFLDIGFVASGSRMHQSVLIRGHFCGGFVLEKKKKNFEEQSIENSFFQLFFFGFILCSGDGIGDHLGKGRGGYCFFSPLMLQFFGDM